LKPNRGAIAAGSSLTVEAGLTALRAGGNAVDAAIAAVLMACVAEPLLCGLGGGGLAMVRMNGRTQVCDMFADMPGRDAPHAPPHPMRTIELDFGPTTQEFHVGRASVAVPGLPAGLWALHAAHARLPLEELAAPAASAARTGVPVNAGFERVGRLLWPIQQLDPEAASLFGRQGRPLVQGDTFRSPQLGETLLRYAAEGPSLLSTGDVGRALVEALEGNSNLTVADLAAYRPRFREAIRYHYHDARVWVPGLPSVAGLLLLHTLRILEDRGPMPAPLSAAQVRFITHAMERTERVRGGRFLADLLEPGFARGFLAALAPHETADSHTQPARAGRPDPMAPIGPSTGHTTHISVVDGDGNAVGITQSLGETAGVMVPGTGVRLNNFLGEADVNPPGTFIAPGSRLMTMCCPVVAALGDRVFAMGSGGSSRIRSAVLHGIVYLTDHGMPPERAVSAARAHYEWETLHVEADGRPPGTMEAVAASYPGMKRFDGPNMFFGGLHMASAGGTGFEGGGDARRSGAFGHTG